MAAISNVAAETGVGSWDEGGVGEAVECTWTLSSDGVLDVDAARGVRRAPDLTKTPSKPEKALEEEKKATCNGAVASP
ncbi:hypothetical protein DIPPA_09374 [Diplonema papillatum]|nr:hypothetical protein DIPPA_09374 [Diplonema papillatum]